MPEVIEAKRQVFLANIQQQLIETESTNTNLKDTLKSDQPATPVNGTSPTINYETTTGNNTLMATVDIKIESNSNGSNQPQKNAQEEETVAVANSSQSLNKSDETSISTLGANGIINGQGGKDAKNQNTQNFKNHNAQKNVNELNGKYICLFSYHYTKEYSAFQLAPK